MNIERMRLFAEVVKHGSYTKAADSLGVSKGYLSQQVKKLEMALGKQLLVRNTRTMRLTSAGEIFFKECEKLTNFWQKTKSLLEQGEEQLAGQVKCTAPLGVARYILWPLLGGLLRAQPDISLLMDSGNDTRNLVRDDYDFAVRITNTPPEDMVARYLSKVDYICCASPAYIASNGAPEAPDELHKFDCLVLPHWNEWSFHQKGRVQQVRPEGKLFATDNDVLKDACLAGMGIARLPQYMIEEELHIGKLVPIFPLIQGDSRGLYLIYPQLSARPNRISLCLQAIEAAFSTRERFPG